MATNVWKPGTVITDTASEAQSGAARSSASSNYDTIEKPEGTDIQVATGKTFYIGRIIYTVSAINIGFFLGYADTGIDDAAGPPTNPIRFNPSFLHSTANEQVTLEVLYAVPADKFPFIFQTGAGSVEVHVMGIEI